MLKSYLISDRDYYSSNPKTLEYKLSKVLEKQTPSFTLLRDKLSSNIEELAKSFLYISQKFQVEKVYLHTDISLAHSLGFDGVHLDSNSFSKIKEAKALNLDVVISTHTKEEVLKACEYGADMVTFSPIFNTPNKGKPKGLELLNEISDTIAIKIIALGGIISQEHIDKIQNSKAYGFASIRYFTKEI